MYLKEIKSFIINQIKTAEWKKDYSTKPTKYLSNYLSISIDKLNVNFEFKLHQNFTNNNFKVHISDLGLNLFYFFFYLLFFVKRSAKLEEHRRRQQDIIKNWNRFLDLNTNFKRDNKINKILD